MTDEETPDEEIDRKTEEFAAAQAEAQQEANDELAARRKAKPTDSRGRQLRFEGVDIDAIYTTFKGTVKLSDIGHLKPGQIVRFEGTAIVNEFKMKNKDGWSRQQVLSPQTLEIVPEFGDETANGST